MATTLLCPGSPRSEPQLRHEQRPGAPSGCAPALREWLDGVSHALCMLPPQLRDYRPFATTAARSRLHLPGTTGLRVRSPWPAANEYDASLIGAWITGQREYPKRAPMRQSRLADRLSGRLTRDDGHDEREAEINPTCIWLRRSLYVILGVILRAENRAT